MRPYFGWAAKALCVAALAIVLVLAPSSMALGGPGGGCGYNGYSYGGYGYGYGGYGSPMAYSGSGWGGYSGLVYGGPAYTGNGYTTTGYGYPTNGGYAYSNPSYPVAGSTYASGYSAAPTATGLTPAEPYKTEHTFKAPDGKTYPVYYNPANGQYIYYPKS
jgi:hypothetical protein